jgi:HD-GYP domain-containing protein (c-di-GMP phosphodiesterase class II)
VETGDHASTAPRRRDLAVLALAGGLLQRLALTPLRVLVVVAELTEVLVLRRLLRDTPFLVEVVRTPAQAKRALRERAMSVVISDDAELIALAGRVQASALRILLADKERQAQLGVGSGQLHVVYRPYFAARVSALVRESAAPGEPEPTARDDVDLEAETSAYRVDGAAAARRQLLITLAELVEARAGIARGHAARVSALAVALGHEARLDPSEIEALDEAALIHDAGELAVASSVLKLQRRLTPTERRQLSAHVELGHQIAQRSGLGEKQQAAVRHHHERWDGRGYPDGIGGAEIPLAARVLAVADVWDAIASERPYHASTTVAECARMLGQLGGAQLDAELVELFLGREVFRVINWEDPPRGAEPFALAEG